MLGKVTVDVSASTMCLFGIPGMCLESETNLLAQLFSTTGLDPHTYNDK